MPDAIAPLEIIICAAQYTPFSENVVYQWCAKSRSGLFAQQQSRSTTQTDLGALLPADVRSALNAAGFTDLSWGDSELAADLTTYLASQGVTASVVDPEEQPPQDPPI